MLSTDSRSQVEFDSCDDAGPPAWKLVLLLAGFVAAVLIVAVDGLYAMPSVQTPVLISVALAGAGSWWVICEVRDDWRLSGASLSPDAGGGSTVLVQRRWPLVAVAAACLVVAAFI